MTGCSRGPLPGLEEGGPDMGVGHRPLSLGAVAPVVGGLTTCLGSFTTSVEQAAEGPGDWAGHPTGEAPVLPDSNRLASRGTGETVGGRLWGWQEPAQLHREAASSSSVSHPCVS